MKLKKQTKTKQTVPKQNQKRFKKSVYRLACRSSGTDRKAHLGELHVHIHMKVNLQHQLRRA